MNRDGFPVLKIDRPRFIGGIVSEGTPQRDLEDVFSGVSSVGMHRGSSQPVIFLLVTSSSVWK